MTFAQANVASNASSGQLFVQAIDVTLSAEPGVSKVDANLVVGTFTWNVYKSAAGSNALGLDWYFAFGYPTAGANSVCQMIMEGYNNGTHQATNYAPRAASVTPAANFANPSAASNLPSSGANICYIQSANIPAQFSYAYSVTCNRVHWEINSPLGPVNQGMSLGIRDTPLPASLDPFPIYCLNVGLNTAVGAALSGTPQNSLPGFQTREPNTLTSNSINFGFGGGGFAGFNFTGLSSTAADTYTGVPYTQRVPVTGRLSTSAFLGLLKDCYMGPVQSNNGDAIQFTLNGVTYTGSRMNTTGVYFLQI